MAPEESLGTWVVVWIVTAMIILLVEMQRRSAGVGLVMSYLASLALNHLVGGAIYLVPWYRNANADIVTIGFQQSTLAVIGFGIGAVLLAPLLRSTSSASEVRLHLPSNMINPQTLVAIGIVSLVALRPLLSRVPTISSVVTQGWSLLLVGLALGAWRAWRSRKHVQVMLWSGSTLCLPLVTVVGQGFLGFGTFATLAVLTFIASFTRPGWKGVVVAVVLAYFALSVYVTYMRDRLEIRDVVWTGQTLGDRIDRVYQTFTDFEWFRPSNPNHLARIDERLNQNVIVGEAVTFLDSGLATYAHGQTLVDAAIAIVPRAIWPTKPVTAGSGNIVSEYTGNTFAEGTSVGIGNVMEAYINFGVAGVVLTFIALGTIIAVVDRRAGHHLRDNNWRGFISWYLPGLSLLQVGGSFVELTSSVAAATLVAYLVTHLGSAPPSVAAQPRVFAESV